MKNIQSSDDLESALISIKKRASVMKQQDVIIFKVIIEKELTKYGKISKTMHGCLNYVLVKGNTSIDLGNL